jgi:hypothetical protein
MRFIFSTILFCLFITSLKADLLKPNSSLEPEDVISIQLSALQKNDTPYDNAGIAQTWEFAHPYNREYTGPLKNFTSMMYSKSYVIMLDHDYHNILLVSKNEDQAFYFIELTDKIGNEFGFQWTLKKGLTRREYI